jgi:putative hydrolase of the HAD superfamily
VDRVAWNEQLLEKSRDRLVGAKKDPFAIIAEMARAIDPSISDEKIRLATENRIIRCADAVTRIPEKTQQVLKVLKAGGKKIGLISNADIMEAAAWDKSAIAPLFDSVIFSCLAGYVKPEREIYELSLKELNVTSADAVFIGDGGSGELEGAKWIGLTTVMITGIIKEIWPERIAERRLYADFVIEQLDELLETG